MLPLELQMVRFRSYRDTTIDFRNRHRVAITGPKGAGKSTCLNGMFWALFGEIAPKVDDKFIVMTSEKDCAVRFDFLERGEVLRVRRTFCNTARPKMTLRLFVQDPGAPDGWRDETRGDLDAVQAIILQKLGLTEEIAEALVFLMQGASDKFPKTKPTARRQMLAELAQCEHWDAYCESAGIRAEAEAKKAEKAQEKRAPLIDLASTLEGRAQALASVRRDLDAARVGESMAQDIVKASSERLAAQQVAHGRIRDARTRHQAKAAEVTAAEGRREERLAALQEVNDRIELAEMTDGAWTAADDAALEEARKAETQATADLDSARGRGEAAADAKRSAESAVEVADRAVQDANAAAAHAWERQKADAALGILTAEANGLKAQQALIDANQAVADARAAAREGWQHGRAEASQAYLDADRECAAAQAQVRDAERALEEARRSVADAWRSQKTAADLAVGKAAAEGAAASKAVANAEETANPKGSILFGEGCTPCLLAALASKARESLPALRESRNVAALRVSNAEASLAALGTEPPDLSDDARQPLATALATAQERADVAGVAAAQAASVLSALGTAAPEPAADILAPLTDRVTAARAVVETREREVQFAVSAHRSLGPVALAASPTILDPLVAASGEARAALQTATTNREQIALAFLDAKGRFESARGERVTWETKRSRLEALVQQFAEARAQVTALQAEIGRMAAEVADLIAARETLLPDADFSRDLASEDQAVAQAIGEATTARDAAVRATAQAESQVRDAERLVAEAEKAAADLAILDTEIDGYRKIEARWLNVARLCVTAQNLIIETILPEASAFTNAMLAELSTTGLSVDYPTQKSVNKGKKLIDRIDIQVTDQKGTRPYESYSGGERFELDWTICLGLLRALVTRSGADIRMVAIDEGFGTHDPDEAARFGNVLNRTTSHIDLILAISHTPEVIEIFEDQIEVENVAGESVAKWAA